MINNIKELNNACNISFCCTQKVLIFVFLLLFLYPGLSVGSEVTSKLTPVLLAGAQDETGDTKADFLFQKPGKYFGFHIGGFFSGADSDLFDMVTRELTLDKSDFQALDFGVDLGINMREKIDLVFSIDHSNSDKSSEFRDFVDEQGLPITQTTSFSQTPLTVGIKYLLMPRGRQVGQYAWLPSTIVPFVGGGVGVLWYEFTQNGSFVDFETSEIFPANLKSSGNVGTLYLDAGADIHLYKMTYLTFNVRYSWAEDDLSQDFMGFNPIDLSGIRLTTGIQWHF